MGQFRKMRGINLPYRKQGYIFFCCLNYQEQPQKMQKKIANLCIDSAGIHHRALFELLTTRQSVTQICLKYSLSEMTLYRVRKKFYESW